MTKVSSADGTTIAYERSGDGPPVILVGGALADRQLAVPYAQALSQRMTVINYDRRGRGESGDTAPYAVDREVEDLGVLIAQAGEWAYVCGFSSGAALAFEAAAAGLAIPKLALFEPPYRVEGGGAQLPDGYLRHLTELTSAGRGGEAIEYFMTAAVGLPAAAVAQMRQGPGWSATAALAPTLVYDSLVLGDSTAVPTARMAAMTAAALVIDSTASPDWLRQAAKATAAALADSRQRSLDGTFHQVPPAILAPVLIDFFIGPDEQ
jgi:alpha-beta hydrolase superfamily lysophospholipase